MSHLPNVYLNVGRESTTSAEARGKRFSRNYLLLTYRLRYWRLAVGWRGRALLSVRKNEVGSIRSGASFARLISLRHQTLHSQIFKPQVNHHGQSSWWQGYELRVNVNGTQNPPIHILYPPPIPRDCGIQNVNILKRTIWRGIPYVTHFKSRNLNDSPPRHSLSGLLQLFIRDESVTLIFKYLREGYNFNFDSPTKSQISILHAQPPGHIIRSIPPLSKRTKRLTKDLAQERRKYGQSERISGFKRKQQRIRKSQSNTEKYPFIFVNSISYRKYWHEILVNICSSKYI